MTRAVPTFAAGAAAAALLFTGVYAVNAMTATTDPLPTPAPLSVATLPVAAPVAATPVQPTFARLPNGLQPFATAPDGQLLCMGSLGPGTCAQITEHMARQAQFPGSPGMQPGMPMPPQGPGMAPMPIGAPGGANTGPMAAGPFPGAGLLPRDGQITMQIAQQCNGEPTCMAGAWMSVEVTRCRNGVFEAGGCFGPNGEIMKAGRVIMNDVVQGPGPNNDIVGQNGWLRRTFGF